MTWLHIFMIIFSCFVLLTISSYLMTYSLDIKYYSIIILNHCILWIKKMKVKDMNVYLHPSIVELKWLLEYGKKKFNVFIKNYFDKKNHSFKNYARLSELYGDIKFEYPRIPFLSPLCFEGNQFIFYHLLGPNYLSWSYQKNLIILWWQIKVWNYINFSMLMKKLT